jgi:hypothetical protein
MVRVNKLTLVLLTILFSSLVVEPAENQEFQAESGEEVDEEPDLESLRWTQVEEAEEIKRVHFVADFLLPGIKRHTGAFRDEYMEVMNIRNMVAKDVYWKFDIVNFAMFALFYFINLLIANRYFKRNCMSDANGSVFCSILIPNRQLFS